MAFYEMLPGAGMPPGLQAGMDSVLNKKFGTSTTYPAAGWPDDVNLLGLLEEKTVSGTIAHITDGADGVPLKKCEITLPASLDGYSEVDLKHAKKNLLLPQNADSSSVTVNGITRSYLLSSQTFTMTGTNTKTDSAWLIFNGSDWIIDGLKKGETYTFYHNLGSSMYSQITYYDTNGALKALVNLAGSAGKNNTRTFTIPSDFDRVRNFQIGVYASATDINEDAVFMLCAGSSATTYEPYEAPTVSTVNLGRTIHGGSVDVVTGQGEGTHANVKVSDLTWTKQTASGRDFFIANITEQEMTNTHDLLVDGIAYSGMVTVANMSDKSLAKWTQSVRIYDSDITTVEGLLETYGNVEIVFYLKTPENFTFTPITPTPETALGVNNFWADSGDSEVTYRSQGTVYQYPEGEEVYF